ncbi:MAG TPA: 16S rRNA (cytosine(1402)-N(4))-methyltransferase RsmH [Chthoniobacteraceae bacterium]|nr:16S rRNA (cytosine(1402)-N(4))-methyltransferase RsmH [Chthoniobacteraceae bacterium]
MMYHFFPFDPVGTRPAANHHMKTSRYHEPVLLAGVLALLEPAPGKLFVDGTLGGGGHTEAFLRAGARVIGIDQDPQALAFAGERLAGFGDAFTPVHANFSAIDEVLDRLGVAEIDGALLDVGVSSWQLDTPERGFSFQEEGPLDMRMDPTRGITAADLVNHAPAEELEAIFRDFGEERQARRVAAQIVRDRALRSLETTLDLVRSVEKVLPRRGRIHPATRVFQGLRIAVNRELEVLEAALTAFTGRLRPGGVLGVITFHSLEDRIVKQFFRTHSTAWLDRPEWPEPRRNPQFVYQSPLPKPVTASEAEQTANPRSRSARLRVARKRLT